MNGSPFDPPSGSLRSHVTRGAIFTGLAQSARLLVHFGNVILLARLLAPGDFGLMAMANAVFGLVILFQNLGLMQVTIQRPNLTHDEASLLFWVNVALGTVLCGCVIAASPLVAQFFNEPRVGDLAAAMGALILLGSLGNQHSALLSRGMHFRALAAIDTVAAVTGLAGAIVGALMGLGYWALYVGTLLTTATLTFGAWIAMPWLPGCPKRGIGIGSMLHFGAGMTGFDFANFFARNLDNILIGRVWGDVSLGLYDRAYKLLLLPLQQLVNPLARVMLPALSQIQFNGERYKGLFRRALNQVLLAALPGIAFMIGTADVLIPYVFGRQWDAAAPIFFTLGFAGLLQALNSPSGWLFVSQGRTSEYMYWGCFHAVTCGIAFLIGLPYGALGVAIAYVVSEYIRTPMLWWWVTRHGPVRFRHVARAIVPHYAGAAVSLASLFTFREYVSLGTLPTLILLLPLSYATSLITIAAFPSGRATLFDSIDVARRIHSKVLKSPQAS